MYHTFIKRLLIDIGYNDVYLKEYGTLCDLREELRECFQRYYTWRTHQALKKI